MKSGGIACLHQCCNEIYFVVKDSGGQKLAVVYFDDRRAPGPVVVKATAALVSKKALTEQ
jgi:hypothetical protein